jgi:hypothetical protein
MVRSGWILEELNKEVEREENKGSTADIGSHVMIVGDDIGIKCVECGSDDTCQRPTEFSCPQEEYDAEDYSQDDNRQA